MATAIKDLTRLGTDVRKIARLLQKKAPPGHKLAYINDEEAALLKKRGGSGRITESGIPSYEEEPIDIGFGPGNYQPTEQAPVEQPISAEGGGGEVGGGSVSAPSTSESAPIDIGFGAGSFTPSQAPSTQLTPSLGAGGGLTSDQTAALFGPQGYGSTATAAQDAGVTVPKTDQDKTQGTGISGKTLATLGIGGLQALLGASQVKQAQAQGQQAKQELQQQALPYQQQGQQLQAAAQRGELTPANQQILQAAQAQAAQSTANRGGVGAMQAQNQINALSQQLLANQLNLGLQLQSVGDKIAQGAIQAGVQADQYVNQLTASYAQNLARTLTTAVTGTQPAQTITLGGGQ
jgi:hypothetical protein